MSRRRDMLEIIGTIALAIFVILLLYVWLVVIFA